MSTLVIVDADVPARPERSNNLFDGDLATSWFSDGDRVNAWFDVTLDDPSEIKQLSLAPRVNSAYPVNVYVDGNFVASYTTEGTDTVAPQKFDLPAGIVGRVVRVESDSNWFGVHEVALRGEALAERARFAVIGDFGNPDETLPEEGNGAYGDEVADLVNTLDPDFIVTVGDNNQKGQPTSPETFTGGRPAVWARSSVGLYQHGSLLPSHRQP